jgi:spore coat protein A
LVVERSAFADEIAVFAEKDATIYEEDGTKGDGAGAHLFVGKNSRGMRRALIAFDVAKALPKGTKISAASLSLSLSRTRSGAADIEVHALTGAWTEGATKGSGNEGGGGPASDGDVTWTHRTWEATAWGAAGGDYVATPSAVAQVGADFTSYEWKGPLLLSDVQRWLDDPPQNFGWIVTGDQVGPKRFDSRTGPDANAPVLLLSYERPSEPSGACCAKDGSCRIALDPGTNCDGAYEGSGSVCSPDPCPPPVGACCHPDIAATCTQETRATCEGALGGTFQGAATACASDLCPVVLAHFVDPLPLPAVATPVTEDGGLRHYQIAVRQTQQKLHRDLPPTTVWGLDDGRTGPVYPGPTIEAQRGTPIAVTWMNDLRDANGALRTTHYLPVDHCLHGASGDAPRTVMHLHGGHVPSAFDGQPELTLLPGQQTTYTYPNEQPAATLWYHDHALGITRLNVVMGIAGFYVLRDPQEEKLDLPSGKYEVPLVIQDRSFHPDGSFRYPSTWDEHAFGNTVLVNGKVWPFLKVDRGRYRFRLLNGSGSRTYALSLSSFEAFVQIGTDGGLQQHPTAIQQLVIAPGERAEIVVDFSKHAAGEEIVLHNAAPAPFPSGMDENRIDDVMKFVVSGDNGFTDQVPLDLRRVEALAESDAVQSRDFVLHRASQGCGGSMWMINDQHWSDITERPHLGTTEVWRFINQSGFMHPMHMHLVMFQVLDHQKFHLDGTRVATDGDPSAPLPSELGLKDTVQVPPFEIVRVIARFEDYAGKFPYHCHILEHEDNEMMRQFEVVASDGRDGGVVDGGVVDAGVQDASLPPPIDAGKSPRADAAVTHGSKVIEKPVAQCGCRLSHDRGGTRPLVLLTLLLSVRAFRRCRGRANNRSPCDRRGARG